MKDYIIRPLLLSDLIDFTHLQQRAYAGVYTGTPEETIRLKDQYTQFFNAQGCSFLGCFATNKLVGCAIIYNFDQNFRGQTLKSTGIGSIAVDLLHKKEGVARSIIQYWLALSNELGFEIAALYPFDPAFYKSFGFGFGAPLYRFKLPPKVFPRAKAPKELHWLDLENTQDLDLLKAFHDELFSTRHGYIKKTDSDWLRLARQKSIKGLVFKEDLQLQGYMLFEQKSTQPQHFLKQSLVVTDWYAQTPTALNALFSFLNAQQDQVDFIDIFSFDASLTASLKGLTYYACTELLPQINHKVADMGLGLMWHVLNPNSILKRLPALPYELKFCIINDKTGIPQNFTHHEAPDLANAPSRGAYTIKVDMSTFASLIMGCIHVKSAYLMGQVTFSSQDESLSHSECLTLAKYIDEAWDLEMPLCTTRF